MSSASGLPALDNTLGALYLGVVLAMALWGAGTVQMYYYFNMYPDDDWRLKLLVVIVWCLDTLHQGFITHSCYIYLITFYAQPAHLGILVLSLIWMTLVSGIICFMVQCFLVLRVWKLSQKNIPILVILMLLVIGEFISVLIYVGKAIHFKTFADVSTIVNESRSINILGVASDVGIAVTLIFLLQRSRTGFRRSETIINRLILFTINTGLLTSMAAAMSLISISVWPTTFIYITFFMCTSKLYSNSLFATLNARKSVLGGLPDNSENAPHTGSVSLNRIRPRATEFPSQTQTNGSFHERHGVLQIKVNTETTNFTDVKYPSQNKNRQPSDSDTDVAAYPYDQKGANFVEA